MKNKSNCGHEIVGIAYLFLIIGCIASLVLAFLIGNLAYEISYEGNSAFLVGIVIFGVGSFFSWIGSRIIQGFGELVKYTAETAMYLDMLVNRTEMPLWEKKPESTSTAAGPTIPVESPNVQASGPIMPAESPDVRTSDPVMPMESPNMQTSGPAMPTESSDVQTSDPVPTEPLDMQVSGPAMPTESSDVQTSDPVPTESLDMQVSGPAMPTESPDMQTSDPAISGESLDMQVSSSDVMEDSESEAEAVTCFACPRCGKILTPGNRFCRYCGEKL